MSIIDALIGAALGLVRGLLALIPTVEFPDLGDFGTRIGGAVSAVNGVFPVVALGTAIGVVVAMRLAIFLVELAIRVYELLPFKAT